MKKIGILQFIDIRVEDPIDKSDTRAFIRVLIWKLNMNFPKTAGKGRLKKKQS